MKRKYCLALILLFLATSMSFSQTISGTIQFYVNTNRIVEDRDYFRYINEVVPIIEANSDKLDHISLIGSFSPEGNRERNLKLANLRASKIYSYISSRVSRERIVVNNDFDLFLVKTGYSRNTEYEKLRATYYEVCFKEVISKENTVKISNTDTVFIKNTEIVRDTVFIEKPIEKTDTVFIESTKKKEVSDKLIFSVYNSISEDLLQRPNIGIEFYFSQLSWFIDGSFSSGTFYGKNYDIDFWHTGLRKYFNDRYDKIYLELYGRTGWFDTDLFAKDDNGVFGVFFGVGLGFGWKFSVCRHWKITPNIRFGFDNFKFNHYYSGGNGGIDVSFGKYINGRDNSSQDTNSSQATNKDGTTVYLNDKTVNESFYKNSYNMYWFGPTYIGIIIQRDFYIHKIVLNK